MVFKCSTCHASFNKRTHFILHGSNNCNYCDTTSITKAYSSGRAKLTDITSKPNETYEETWISGPSTSSANRPSLVIQGKTTQNDIGEQLIGKNPATPDNLHFLQTNSSCSSLQSSIVDDTDSDPNYSPENEDLVTPQKGRKLTRALSLIRKKRYAVSMEVEKYVDERPLTEELGTMLSCASSPVREEQVAVAGKVEKYIDDLPSPQGSYSNSFGITGIQEPTAEGEAFSMNASKVKVGNWLEKNNYLAKKLDSVQFKINKWKKQREEAERMCNKSASRRLSRIIKKYKQVAQEVVEPGTVTDVSEISEKSRSNWTNNNEDILNKETRPMKMKNECQRKKNFCIYCNKLVLKFCLHIERNHQDTPEGRALREVAGDAKTKRLKKIVITDPLRKQWNGVYNAKNSFIDIIPVKRRHGGKQIGSIKCRHCKGEYRRDKLSVHLKHCSVFKSIPPATEGKVCAIKDNSVVDIAFKDCVSNEFCNEVLNGVRADDIMITVLNDPLILKFGSDFHSSRREHQSRNYILREMRDIAKLLIKVKENNQVIQCLKDLLNPAHFNNIIEGALSMAGYDCETGQVKVPSVAYRLCQPLKDCATLVKNEELKKLYSSKSNDRTSITMMDDFLNQIKSEWKIRIGRICRKALKIAKVGKPQILADERDIIKLAAYIEGQYRSMISDLNSSKSPEIYNMLTHYVISHIMLLVRRRPVDFKLAKLRHFGLIDRHDELLEMTKKDLNPTEIKICKKFNIFYVPGKNLDIVPIVLTQLMRIVVEELIKHRPDVNITCDTLFVLADDKPIEPTNSLSLVKQQVKLFNPKHLTGNGLRHQAATFSRLHSDHPQYQDFLASVLGHSLHVHKKNYQLPVGILQKLMVCPILHSIMKGRKNKVGDANEPTETETYMSNQGEVLESMSPIKNFGNPKVKETHLESGSSSHEYENWYNTPKMKKRWTVEEQETVLHHFSTDILNKCPPSRQQVKEFLTKHPEIEKRRTLAQVVMFVRNHALRGQLNVTPKIKDINKKYKNNN